MDEVRSPTMICIDYDCHPAESGDLLARGETLYYTSPSTHSVEAFVGDVHKRVAGTGDIGFGGDGGFAQAARLNRPRDLALSGSGALYVVDSGNGTIRVLEQPFPGMADGESAVVAPDGASYFVFDENGRHLRTVDALFGTNIRTFAYDGAGYLTSITDVDGNVTRIERSGTEATAIVAPGGQRTELAYHGDGRLRSSPIPRASPIGLPTTRTGCC